MIIANHRR